MSHIDLPHSEIMTQQSMSFEEAQPFIYSEIARWFEERGHDLTEKSVQLSIETNTSRIPKRAESLLNVIGKYTPLPSLEGLRVLDVGCGYGALSIYMLLEAKPAEIVAIDPDTSFLSVAQNTAQHMGLSNIDFLLDDMTQLTKPQGLFDVVILNNSFIYLPKTKDIRAAIANFHRLLKPGGVVVVYGPNRWYYREAFTKLIGVQFMPYWLSNWYVKLKGKMKSYDHLRLLSPWDFFRFFSQAGFKQCDTIMPYKNAGKTGWKRFFRPYIFFVAIK